MSDAAAIGERTEAGLEFRLRPRGAGRFFGAAFLTVWLCGWAAGETFALWFLVRGAVALAGGQPFEPGREPQSIPAALLVGLFLLFWLSMWTVGGVLAMRELLRSLSAEDRVIVGAGELVHEGRLGPFRSRRRIAGADVTAVRIVRRTGALVVDTRAASREITRLGTTAEREAAATLLRRELRLEERPAEPGDLGLPEGWQEILTPEGTQVLAADPALRARQARVAGAVALVVVSGTLLLLRATVADLTLLPLAALGVAASAGLVWGTLWLAQGRTEWRIGSGRIVQQSRFRGRVRERFEATALELTVTADSDGDDWIAVEALAPGAGAESTPPLARRAAAQRGVRRRIHHAMEEDAVPRRLAQWLARRADLPLADRTTRAARDAEIAGLRAQLAGSGRFGALAAKLIDRAGR